MKRYSPSSPTDVEFLVGQTARWFRIWERLKQLGELVLGGRVVIRWLCARLNQQCSDMAQCLLDRIQCGDTGSQQPIDSMLAAKYGQTWLDRPHRRIATVFPSQRCSRSAHLLAQEINIRSLSRLNPRFNITRCQNQT
jgi:hypothetical protein